MFIMMNNAWLLLTMVIDDYCRDSSIEFVDFPSHVGKITQGLRGKSWQIPPYLDLFGMFYVEWGDGGYITKHKI
jgi:hypothetical protein